MPEWLELSEGAYVAILLLLAIIMILLALLIRREQTWFHRHDELQDKYIKLLYQHRELLTTLDNRKTPKALPIFPHLPEAEEPKTEESEETS